MCKKFRSLVVLMTIIPMMLAGTSCAKKALPGENLISDDEEEKKVILLFAPIERSKPDAENVARSAFDKTVIMAEEELGLSVEYRTYTSEGYQEKSYDDVSLDRIRNNMDDFYLINPDVLQKTGEEGLLYDMSGMECAKNLRDVVRTANTVDGKLVGIPQEVVVYGLFVNKDMFDQYDLKLPNTPEEFKECCRVFKENGIETPIGLAIWASIPASIASLTSSAKALAVIAMIGISFESSRSRRRIALAASYPFITGICTSIRIAAYLPGSVLLNRSTASCPFSTISQVASSISRISDRISALISLSSATRKCLPARLPSSVSLSSSPSLLCSAKTSVSFSLNADTKNGFERNPSIPACTASSLTSLQS